MMGDELARARGFAEGWVCARVRPDWEPPRSEVDEALRLAGYSDEIIEELREPSEIVFVGPGEWVGLRELSTAELVIGVFPNGTGRALKSREGREGDLSAECVAWLRADPTRRPEDFEA